MDKFLQLSFGGLSLGAVYALIALGFVIVFKGSNVFNFAQAQFVMLGAYLVVAWAATMPFGVAVVLAVGVVVAVTATIEHLVLRRMIGRPAFSIIMATLGLAIMVRAIVLMQWGYQPQGRSDPIGPGVTTVGDVVLADVGLWTVGCTVVLLVGLRSLYRNTGYGLALRATAANQEAALAQGIDIRRMFAISWGIAGALAVVAGVFLGAFPRQVTPDMDAVALNALPAVILGGFDSLPGAVIGGVLIGLLQVLGAGYLADVGPGGVHEILPYVVMLAVLLVRPHGLFGSAEIERV